MAKRQRATVVVMYDCNGQQSATIPMSVFADNFGAQIAVAVSCPSCGGYHEFDVTNVGPAVEK
jgi:hypothetical protein